MTLTAIRTKGGHFVEKCSCGDVIRQCRCFSPDKSVTIIPYGCDKCAKFRPKPQGAPMKSAIDIDRRDLSEMTAYHEARIEALQRVVREQERTIDELRAELEKKS